MNIVKAEARHIPGMLRLLGQVGQVHHEIRPDIFRDGALKYDEAALQELLRDENKRIFIGEDQGQVVAHCFCVLKDYRGSSAQTDRVELYIDDLCVDESCRRMGIARALYQHALEYCRTLGCQSLTLNVWCGNDGALRFYEAMGLRPRNILMEIPLEESKC